MRRPSQLSRSSVNAVGMCLGPQAAFQRGKMSEISIACVGDIVLGNVTERFCEQEGSARLRERLWAGAGAADLILANLEAPVTESRATREDKLFNFRASASALAALDPRCVLSLANNHMMDFGPEGLFDTLAALDNRGFTHAGAGRNLEEARRPAMVEVNGVTVAVICVADPRYSPAGADSPGTCPASPALLRETLQDLRGRVQVIIVSCHMGMEYLWTPSPLMSSTAELCLNEGARIVLFHHAHRVSGETRDERGLVIWGAGNYVFTQGAPAGFRPWYRSLVWRVALSAQGKGVDALERHPVVLDGTGIPRAANGKTARRIQRTVERCSRRLDHGWTLALWRVLGLFNPSYLRIAMGSYLDMLRWGGVACVARAVYSTVATQILRKTP